MWAEAELGVVVWLIRDYGIEGAAIAWTVRVTVDALFLFGMASHFFANVFWMRRTTVALVIALLAFASAAAVYGFVPKGFFLLAAILVFAFSGWFVIHSPEEHNLAWAGMKPFQAPSNGD